MPENKDVSKLLFMIYPCYNSCSAKTQQTWKNAWLQLLFYNKKGTYHRVDSCNWNCELAFKKEVTASACLKETQYPISLQVSPWSNDSNTQMCDCKCCFEMQRTLNRNICHRGMVDPNYFDETKKHCTLKKKTVPCD